MDVLQTGCAICDGFDDLMITELHDTVNYILWEIGRQATTYGISVEFEAEFITHSSRYGSGYLFYGC